jgi:hypothetical protein
VLPSYSKDCSPALSPSFSIWRFPFFLHLF